MLTQTGPADHFNLEKHDAYLAWRDDKLSDYPQCATDMIVTVNDMGALSGEETAKLIRSARKTNMALYCCHAAGAGADEAQRRHDAVAFAEQLGLHRSETHRSAAADGLVSLQVSDKDSRANFIPYTNKPLSWHTDGYYNKPKERIRAMFLHFVRPAATGGENALFDPEIAYIRLRDENPAYITALRFRRAMTIPSFTENSGCTRPECTGPVFSNDRFTGALHMRFTNRKRNISWCRNNITDEALAFLRHILESDPLILRYRFNAGEGVICNNVLHSRDSFEDVAGAGQGRLVYRARYMDRIAGT